MRKIIFRLTFAVIIVVTYSLPASALLGDTIGIGVRATSMGEAFVAIADDYSATYYNPAGLGQQTDIFKLTVDFMYPAVQFDVNRLTDNQYDPTDPTDQNLTGQELNGLRYPDHFGRESWNPNKTAAGDDLDDIDHNRPIIGISANLNKICSAINIPKNLTLGMIIMLPNNIHQALTLINYVPDVPQFTRFGDADEQIFLALGMGVEWIEDLLYFGVSAKLEIYGDGHVHNNTAEILYTDIDPNRPIDAQEFYFQMQIDWRVFGRLNPMLGVLYTPLDEKLKIGLTYREKTLFKIGPCNLYMNQGSGPQEQASNIPWNAVLDFYIAYQPQEWALGVAYDLSPNYTVTFGLEFQKWSKFGWSSVYHQDYYQSNPRIQGYLPYGPDFDDVYNTSVGLEYKYNDDITIMAGYQYAPTPVPDQTGRVTNYLDMDKDIFSIGATYDLKKDFIKIGGMFQYMLCEDYEVYKNGVRGIAWPAPDSFQDSYEVSGDAYVIGVLMEINF